MAATNFYLGLKRGDGANPGAVVAGSTSNGANSDVEVRIQTNNGTAATGITRLDTVKLLDTIRRYIMGNNPSGGADTPAL